MLVRGIPRIYFWQKHVYGVFEGVENDFANNFSVWKRFLKISFFGRFWAPKNLSKIEKIIKKIGPIIWHELKLKK